VAKIDASIDQFPDRIVEADNPSVISACEAKIAKLEKQKLPRYCKITANPKHSFEEMFELALRFLSNSWKLWDSGQLPHAQNSAGERKILEPEPALWVGGRQRAN
jgi:hypothetical protein